MPKLSPPEIYTSSYHSPIICTCIVYGAGSKGTRSGGGAGGDRGRLRSFIQLKDKEFLGEDRILQAELSRRMAASKKRSAISSIDLNDPRNMDRLEKLEAMRTFSPRDYNKMMDRAVAGEAGEGGVHTSRRHTHKQNTTDYTDSDKPGLRSHKEKNRNNRAFIYSANMRTSMALSLQLMEQAIYTVQYRFMDIKKYTSKYVNDPAFRIAFIMRQLKDWLWEMQVWHKWLSDTKKYDNSTQGTSVSLLYYQYMVRNHVDITQSVYYVIHLHETLVARMAGLKDPPMSSVKKEQDSLNITIVPPGPVVMPEPLIPEQQSEEDSEKLNPEPEVPDGMEFPGEPKRPEEPGGPVGPGFPDDEGRPGGSEELKPTPPKPGRRNHG